jgi:adenosylcobinamide-phosphate synthase
LPAFGQGSASPLAIPVALALDAVLGEPPTAIHPVVWIGRAASWLEQRAPDGTLARLLYGGFMTVAVGGGAALAGAGASRLATRLPWPLGLLMEGWVLKTTLSARALIEAGTRVEMHLQADDLTGARQAVTALVSRDVTTLSPPSLVSAAVESLAENTADSIVGPLWYYAWGGLPAALAYRAANTLDAMIGYHGRYEQLGKASARVDDLLNLVPARLSAALLLGGGALAGGDVATGLEIMRRDHSLTASPNAGWPMSAMAGLLALRLEKPDHYRLGAELPAPDLAAIDHAAEIVKAATILTVPLMLGVRWLRRALGR